MAEYPILTLRHGTTRRRAEHLLTTPPNPNFVDPGGQRESRADGFSTVVAGFPNLGLGTPEEYARSKASNFPDEGGPVILEIDVPDEIVDLVRNDSECGWMVAMSGEVRFEPTLGLNELCQAWPTLVKRIIPL